MNKNMKILIVMEEGIGNMVMLTPAIQAIQKLLPTAEIDIFGRQPSIQVIPPRTNLVQKVKAIDKLLDVEYDIGFFTVWSQQFKKQNQDWINSHIRLIYELPFKIGQHETDHYMTMARWLGYTGGIPKPYCHLQQKKININNYIVLSDTTNRNGAWERKRWLYYQELTKRLVTKGFTVVFIGGKQEAKESLNKLKDLIQTGKVIDLRGRCNISETAYIIKNAKMFVGNDSGTAHIAGAVGTCGFVFFGATLISKNKPSFLNVITKDLPCSPCQYTERWQNCKDWKCMDISVDEVLKQMFSEKVKIKTNSLKLAGKEYKDCKLIERNNIKYLQKDNIKEQLTIHLVGAGKSNFPWGMENEIRRALELMGVKVIETDYRLEDVKNQDAHLILVCKGSGISPEVIKKFKGKTILWYQDDIFSVEHARRDLKFNGKAFDLVYTFDKSAFTEYANIGIQNVRYLPLAMSPQLHRKLPVEKKYKVLFVGNVHPNRKRLLEKLHKKFNLTVARAFMDDMVLLINQSEIVLNLGIGQTGIQQRVFEVLGCGSFLLTNVIPKGDRFFQDGVHLKYFTDETIEKHIEYYLTNEDEREKIAYQGYLEVQKHTWKDRMEKIIKDNLF